MIFTDGFKMRLVPSPKIAAPACAPSLQDRRAASRPARRLFRGAAVSAALSIGSAAVLSGCGTPGDALPPVEPAPPGYTLGGGDQIRISTFGEPALTGDFRVGDAGTISVPLLGSVPAAGLTTDGLAKSLTSDVVKSQLMKDPKIGVEVAQYRPVFILGEVSKPGEYPYQPGMTVVSAVAIAGGFTYRAVKGQFSIVRTPPGAGLVAADGGSPPAVEGKAERQTAVRPGDVITVYERFF